ncbi:endolytic transglycosylase MltG [uncultured Treponema sp.]|uniref:endolytic transglycosylase MltG n=1 Tax=uncultured Treponema sp. TaxID=162155 RepID=UPI0025D638BB|nr:endolytic transglycosylase MltG [uncultured Treponema sp.]
MKNKKNTFISFVLSAFACVVLAFLACFLAFRVSLSAPDSQSEAKSFRVEIPSGSSVARISEILVEKGLIRSDRAFYLAARFPFLSFRNTAPVLQSGFYNLNSAMDALQIMAVLESGVQDYTRVSVPEGFTLRKIAALLEKNEVCNADDFIEVCQNPILLEKYGIPSHSFEGFLFPDTYFFAPGMGAEKALEMMLDSFFSKISEIPYFAGKSPSAFYDTLVLASIVEREYRVQEEAPLIASVFKNRIDAGVGLYSCATIEYIITEIQGKPHPDIITYDDLKIDSPYNTYKWAALPPSPISNPGIVALKAAANPPQTDYFYFTLTDSASGSHTFSKSFNAHVKAGTNFKTKKN